MEYHKPSCAVYDPCPSNCDCGVFERNLHEKCRSEIDTFRAKVQEQAAEIEQQHRDSLSLIDQIVHLTRQRDEAMQDAERLDFLEVTGGKCIQSCGYRWYSRSDYGRPHKLQNSLREAIDAAIKGSEK